MDFLKTLKKKSMRTSMGWAAWLTLFGLLLLPFVTIAGLILLALAVFIIVYAASGQYQKQPRKKAEELSPNDPEAVLERAARLRETEPIAKGMWIGSGLVYFERGARQWLYGSQEVCWAYLQTTTHRIFYLIPIWRSHALMLRTTGGSMHELPMGKKKVLELLEKLNGVLTGCVTGYSRDLEKLYFSDKEQFAANVTRQTAVEQ